MMTRTTKKGRRGAILLCLALALLASPSWLVADSASKDAADVDGQMRSRVDALLKAAWKDASVKPAPVRPTRNSCGGLTST